MNINLDLSSNSNKIFTDDSIIQQDIFSEVKEKILGRAGSISDKSKLCYKKNSSESVVNLPMRHSAIMISGSRGAGKTSFLFSLRHDLQYEEECINDLEILDFLDPTLIEAKVHIFFTIISLVKSRVEDKFSNCGCDNDISLCKKKFWKERLLELAKGLPFIDNADTKTPEYWDDATQILNKALDDAHATFNLRKNFDEFLECSLEILGKKAFLLSIDDIDTKFEKAWLVLETIRKYLATKYIITILSGDFELFSISVRKYQWENFGDVFINLDSSGDDKKTNFFKQKITELESQYIEKILPVENRYFLRSFKDILEDKRNKIFIKFDNEATQIYKAITKNDDDKLDYRTFYKSIFHSFGLYNDYEIIPFRDVIETFPTRTQISLLRIFEKTYFREFGKNYKEFLVNKPFFDENQFLNLFVSYFTEKSIRVSDLRNPSYINIEILKFLMKIDSLDNLYQIQPIDSDSQKNIVLFVLNFLLCFYMNRNKQLIFDNIIRIGYVRNIFPLIKFDEKYTKNVLIEKVGLNQTKTTKVLSSMLLAELHKNKILNDYGNVYIEKNFDLIEEINESSLSEAKKAVALLPACILTEKKKSQLVYSFYNLLACINDIFEQNIKSENARKILSSIAQVRSYIVDGAESGNSDENSDKQEKDFLNQNENEETQENDKNNDEWKIIGQEISRWKEYIESEKFEGSVAVHVLNKVSTRVFYTLKEIQKEKINNITKLNKTDSKAKNANKEYINSLKDLAELMNLFVCQLFNSAIIEEYNEAKNEFQETSGIVFTNLLTSSKTFISNLKKVTRDNGKKYFPLTRILLSCPILMLFVEKDVLKELKNFLEKVEMFKDGIREGQGFAGKPDFSYYENNIFAEFSKADKPMKTSDSESPEKKTKGEK